MFAGLSSPLSQEPLKDEALSLQLVVQGLWHIVGMQEIMLNDWTDNLCERTFLNLNPERMPKWHYPGIDTATLHRTILGMCLICVAKWFSLLSMERTLFYPEVCSVRQCWSPW